MAKPPLTLKITAFLLLGAAVVLLQIAYDFRRPQPSGGAPGGISAGGIRIVDLGFHPAVGSFLWAATMPEFLDFFRGQTHYLSDLAFLNTVDPKLSYPYAFSVLVLPAAPKQVLPDAVQRANAIGMAGIAAADPDWRIPYYMAINYYLELKDLKDAIWYFSVAAQTPGIPSFARSFALNFGISQKERDRVRGIWETVYRTTNDLDTKARAAAFIERLNEFDYLEGAVRVYREKYGRLPSAPDDLVSKKIIPALPQDPLGFTFKINKDGTVGLDYSKPPSYLLENAASS